MPNENLGPAERILQSLLNFTDHCVHNRPGIVMPDPTSPVGAKWMFAKPRNEGKEGEPKQRVLYQLTKRGVGKKAQTVRTRLGVISEDGKTVMNGAVRVGEYRKPGFFTETVVWLYKQIAEVWKLDNEFAAKWASHAFAEKNKDDLKVLLAAFMLVQSRAGEPVVDQGKLAFLDEDYREVGEAMLLFDKDKGGFNPKLVHRVRELLCLPEIAKLNHELGFGKSARAPTLGRWPKAVERYLRYRELNPKMLEGVVRAGFRQQVISLASQIRYVPMSTNFYRALRWKQYQAKDGHRKLALNEQVTTDSWEGLTEEQVCERIVKDRPKWNRLSVMLPKGMGLTRAIMGAAIETGALSDKELINLAPTIEELGLLKVQGYRERLDKAFREAENMRAANIALRMKSKEGQEKLQQAADTALQKQVAEVMKDVFIYVLIDVSGSMTASLAVAMQYIIRFLQGFPLEKMAVVAFQQTGRVIEIKHASKAGVENAFRGITAGGGTDHSSGVRAVTTARKPGPNDDVIMLFIGDGGERGTAGRAPERFVQSVKDSRTNPVAFGFLQLPGENFRAVELTAEALGIPCFAVDERIFGQVAAGGDIDPYAIPRAIRTLISAAPVGRPVGIQQAPRVTLVDTILKTELLKKPAWALVPVTRTAAVVAA
jgi:Mg-chelatase subunit ChlD